MDGRRAQEIAGEWENEARARLGDPTRARVVLQRALVSFVPDDAPVAVLIDDDTTPVVGAVVGTRLLLATASADDGAEPTAACTAVALNADAQISVTYAVRQSESNGLYSQRRWTVVPQQGAPVSFYTATAGREGPDTPFVRSLAQALGWSMPADS